VARERKDGRKDKERKKNGVTRREESGETSSRQGRRLRRSGEEGRQLKERRTWRREKLSREEKGGWSRGKQRKKRSERKEIVRDSV